MKTQRIPSVSSIYPTDFDPLATRGELALWAAVVYQALTEEHGRVNAWIKTRDFRIIVGDILGMNVESARSHIQQKLHNSMKPFPIMTGRQGASFKSGYV